MKQFWISLGKNLRRYVSPIFIILLVAAFILWYISKLDYTYTTEQKMRVNVDGEKFTVACVVEGMGTNLFRYKISIGGKHIRIPLTELKYKVSHEEGHEGMITFTPQSLQNALSVRLSDIKVVSVGTIPEIAMPVIEE